MSVRARKMSMKNDLGGTLCLHAHAHTRLARLGSLLAGSRSQSFPCLHKDSAH